MKVNSNDTDGLFEKSFTKYPFDSEKKWCQIGLTKTWFLIDSPLFKKAVEFLTFCISAGSNSILRHNPWRNSKQFCIFVLSSNLSE